MAEPTPTLCDVDAWTAIHLLKWYSTQEQTDVQD